MFRQVSFYFFSLRARVYIHFCKLPQLLPCRTGHWRDREDAVLSSVVKFYQKTTGGRWTARREMRSVGVDSSRGQPAR